VQDPFGPDPGASTDAGDDAGSTSSAEASSQPSGSSSGAGDDGPKLDVAPLGEDTGTSEGCQKVDFLFVIDNSGSMAEEQQQLIASFPGFVAAIEQSVAVDDFHVMVVDSDEWFAVDQCAEICPDNPEDTCVACAGDEPGDCVDVPCAAFPPRPGCDGTIGAGAIGTPGGVACGVAGPGRFLVSGQDDLAAVFDCIADVGIGANGERPMDAMVAAVGPLQEVGACDEGFLRDDAILVVTVISDEEDSLADDGIASAGDPPQWRQALIDAKHGDDQAIVFLGLVGDNDVPAGVCEDADPPQAAPAPRLRELAESLPYGQWHSVCVDDYTPFFADAIEVIDSACDDFRPAG